MASMQHTTIVGVFDDREDARRAVAALKQAGFTDDQIGVVSHGESGKAEAHGTMAAQGAVAGAAAGAGVGALWALGIAAGVLPGIGPAIAGGLLASVLASAAGGAVAAGIAGALVGLGIPEEEAKYYEGEFRAGRTVVTVRSARNVEAWDILSRHGAYNRDTRGQATTAAAGGQTIQVKEERLHAQKRPVQTGEVTVRKEVHTGTETVRVPVEREEVVVERRPAGGRAAAADIKAGEEVRIPVREDKVDVSKEAVVTEEVAVRKRKVQDTSSVSGTVRKEEVKVEKEGDVDVRHKGKPS
jgi:uncharacterized protein (TIGR02271 family)